VQPAPTPPSGIRGELSRLYDAFVDWPGRLGREVPGIERHLAAAGARKVLDLGCGTGRHVHALVERGYDAHGADASQDMLAQAGALLGGSARLHPWTLGEPPTATVRAQAPFDAVIALGNVWPLLVAEREVRGAAEGLRAVLRPDGLVLLGLKAFAVRRASGDPHLPLLRREHEGRALWFLRFLDWNRPPLADGTAVGALHMAVVAGDVPPDGRDTEGEALLHRASLVRLWSPDGLAAWWRERGFEDVRVSGRLDDPQTPALSEDVFVSCRAPATARSGC
jgi:SAM-dependent methyltransferase